jgi:hypothetical protein
VKRRAVYVSPFLIWTDLALKCGEMMLASAQVIGHRTARFAAASIEPGARDRRELALMGQEKAAAAIESAQAMAAYMMSMNPFLGARAARQMLATAAAMMSLAGSRTAAQGFARQARLVRTLRRSGDTLSQISRASAQLAQRGMAPVHARATANAKRLRKKRR